MPHLLFTGKPETGKKLLEVLDGPFIIRPERQKNRTTILLDTFDWRLYHNGLMLTFCQKKYLLRQLKKQPAAGIIAIGTRQQPYRFFREFPDGDLKKALAPVIDVRTLLPVLSIDEAIQPLRLLNREEKTLVKLEFTTLTAQTGQSVLQLIITPLRGYHKAAHRVEELIAGVEGLHPVASSFAILQTIGNLQPDIYSSKLDITLDPEQPAAEATSKILLRLLNTMKANEEGIKKDLDTEFLHDYRVAVRRTRAVLGQIKQVFPAEKTSHFRKIFTELGRQTNLLRDLDVYLLHHDHFNRLLPPTLQPGLNAFFLQLTKKRRSALKQVRQLLNSAAYRQQQEEWKCFLEKAVVGAENAKRPIKDLASFFIYRRYYQIIKAGQRITSTSPDEDLHQLRISGKKLRYLLEFFASIYPHDRVKLLINQLKKLQDNLGEFNDLSIQQDYLHAYLETLGKSGPVEILNAAAIGGLLARLHERQQQVREAFAMTFSRFNNPEIQTTFHHLFESRRS